MTLKEATEVICWLERIYWRKKDDEARKDLIKLWAAIFIHYEKPVVEYAVTQYIKRDERGCPPMPGQVMKEIKELEHELHSANLCRRQTGNPTITLVNIVQFRIEDEIGENGRYLQKGRGNGD